MNYENNFATNLTSNQLAAVTTTPLNSIPTVDAPFYLAFDATNVNGKYEVVYCTGKTATNVNHAATAYEHTTAEEVRMIVPASYLNSIQNLQEGGMVNGMISVTDAAGITLALKTKAGTDPSVTDPVFAMISGAVRVVTAALSISKADGTSWCNAGSAELATKEIDYFAYLGYNATDGVVIGFSRFPGASSYDDFSTTTTNEKYCAISTITNAAATDYYNVIGRFAATLSAGAGYTWTVQTFTAKNLIQRPIYETRWLNYNPNRTASGGTTPTYTLEDKNRYKIAMDILSFGSNWENSSGGTAGSGTVALEISLPFSVSTDFINEINRGTLAMGAIFESGGTAGFIKVNRRAANTARFSLATALNVVANDQSATARQFSFNGQYEI